MVTFRFMPAALLLCALTSCHLLDQRVFNPQAGAKPKPPVAPVAFVAGPAPLVTIRYTQPDPPYAPELEVAVKRALSLKTDVLFTVQILVPLATTPEAQATALQEAAAAGREIAEAMIADGADQGQIELSVRADPGVAVREVRIFVR